MWYTALPSAILISCFLLSVDPVNYYTNKYVNGNPYKRHVITILEHYNYLRDYRLSGDKNNAYHQVGLEAIPDVENSIKP